MRIDYEPKTGKVSQRHDMRSNELSWTRDLPVSPRPAPAPTPGTPYILVALLAIFAAGFLVGMLFSSTLMH